MWSEKRKKKKSQRFSLRSPNGETCGRTLERQDLRETQMEVMALLETATISNGVNIWSKYLDIV